MAETTIPAYAMTKEGDLSAAALERALRRKEACEQSKAPHGIRMKKQAIAKPTNALKICDRIPDDVPEIQALMEDLRG